jgi:hypothetical protein
MMLSHGISYCSVFHSVWGLVDVINNCLHFDTKFPDLNGQLILANGFRQKSGASFDEVIGTIDGILIWTLKPSKQECKDTVCGEKSFLCHRKDKFGLNMQAICDDKLCFMWIDISWRAWMYCRLNGLDHFRSIWND